ncbi:MAG TPA: AAA family ATPase [Candidatus Paceibacterota bacterium]
MAVAFSELSPDQVDAVNAARAWYQSRDARPFRVFGPAGSGKTTVASHIIAALGTTTQALAPTNRAARILRTKGVHSARTIHSVLFRPLNWCWTNNHQVDSTCIQEESKHQHAPRFFKREDPPEGVKCFTIDEASMVGRKIAEDIEMFRIKTLVIGDPYQLPPVMDHPGYTTDLPGVDLDSSHRFDSMSDIGKLANIIRVSSGLKDWHKMLTHVGFNDVDQYDLLLAWRNETRWQIINTLRAVRGLAPDRPQVGDRLISVANTYEVNVLNADELTVAGEPYEATNMGAWNIPTREVGVVQAWKSGFQDFDGEKWAAQQSRRKGANICALTFSECMTVHKAQGGEWARVLIVDDLSKMNHVVPDDLNTWAYTAVTRASEQIDFIKIGEFPTGMALRKILSSAGV